MTDRERDSGNAGEQERAHEFLPRDPREAVVPAVPMVEVPLDPWMRDLVQHAMRVDESDVPRELMWARIRQQRRGGAATSGEHALAVAVAPPAATPVAASLQSHAAPRRFGSRRAVGMQILAVAATLAIGVAIGRFGVPNDLQVGARTAPQVATAAGTQGVHQNDPAVVAMEEHLARTVALLVTVRDESPDVGPGADVSGWARELLGTTRMLLDEPQLRDDRTRRLLQDLELVLVQIIQARGTAAPEARRAPSETMRETNLLPRVRAVVTASNSTESTFRGIAE
jgi:hypothetical protein